MINLLVSYIGIYLAMGFIVASVLMTKQLKFIGVVYRGRTRRYIVTVIIVGFLRNMVMWFPYMMEEVVRG